MSQRAHDNIAKVIRSATEHRTSPIDLRKAARERMRLEKDRSLYWDHEHLTELGAQMLERF